MRISVNQRLRSLYHRNDPALFYRVHLDQHSMQELMRDHEARAMGEIQIDRDGPTWRGLPIVVEATGIRLQHVPTASEVTDKAIPNETQITIECKRLDNARIFYLDDADNTDIWKLQGAPK